MLKRLLWMIAPWYAWRLECLCTVDAVAEHFIRHHLGAEAIRLISLIPAPNSEVYAGTELAWKRRISFIYGVATHYDVPGRERGRAGWNRPLLDDCKAKDPEEATREIFHRIWQKVREAPDPT